MAYHVPMHETWRAKDVARSLQKRGIEAAVVADRVNVVLPVVEFMDIDKILAAESVGRLEPRTLGQTTANISYHGERILDNITVDYELHLLTATDRHPDLSLLRQAMQECNYLWGTEREIALLYLPDDPEAVSMMDEIDALQAQKEALIERQEFTEAGSVLQRQRVLRRAVEGKIRRSAE